MFFERFTEKARTVVVLAQQQARERGDDAIDTGHLLRALFAVPDNLAVMVLEGFSVRRADVEADLDRRRPATRPAARRTRARSPRWASTSTRSAAGSRRRSVRARWTGPAARAAGGGAATSRSPRSPRRPWSWRCARRSPSGTTTSAPSTCCWRCCAAEGVAHDVLVARGVRLDAARVIVEELVRGRRGGAEPGECLAGPASIGAVRIDVVTIFPAYLAPLREALLGRALERELIDLAVHDLRTWTHDVHQAVDDAPYGGGPGMVMRPQVWGEALDAVVAADPRPPRLVVPTPAGRPFTQATARAWAAEQRLVFACGRYEGIDQRVVDEAAARMPVDEVSIGDYVLVGGEAAVLVMVEAVVRLLPGVLGNPASAAQDSFSDGLLEGPSYTRPEVWRGPRGSRGAAQRQPRRDRAVAPRPGAGADGGPAARAARRAARRTRSTPRTGRCSRGLADEG